MNTIKLSYRALHERFMQERASGRIFRVEFTVKDGTTRDLRVKGYAPSTHKGGYMKWDYKAQRYTLVWSVYDHGDPSRDRGYRMVKYGRIKAITACGVRYVLFGSEYPQIACPTKTSGLPAPTTGCGLCDGIKRPAIIFPDHGYDGGSE